MASVNFIYEGIKTKIQCLKEDNMKNICNKYASKIEKNINSVYFLYNGNQINYDLTFYEQANSTDKQSMEMNILVYNIIDSDELKCPKCGCNLFDNKIINDIIKYNDNINNMLNELKNQIEYITDLKQIENKKRIINFIINDIIKENEKIKREINSNLNNELQEYHSVVEEKDISYNNFDIKIKNPIHILKQHNGTISCATVLNDGRFATCSYDRSLIIYDKKKFKSDLIIKIHDDSINYILQLSTGLLASCSDDHTIKILNINSNNYEVLQILNDHKGSIYKIIELSNKKLVSCSDDSSIIVYSKDNNKYIKEYQINTNDKCFCLIQTKENEICFYDDYSDNKGSICFYDLTQKKITATLKGISSGGYNFMNMITKDLLVVTGDEKITIINVNQYNIARIIDVQNSSYINVSCVLNENFILTGDYNGHIKQWKIEGDNLILISTKENAHNDGIYTLIKLEDGHILSGSDDGEVKIW